MPRYVFPSSFFPTTRGRDRADHRPFPPKTASGQGFGQHFLLIGETHAQQCIRLFYIANATYALQTALIKISILLQYLRMLRPKTATGGNGGRLRLWCLSLIVVSAVWGTIYSVMAWAPCVPVSGYWNWDLVLTGRARCWGFGSQNPVAFDAAFASHNATNMLLGEWFGRCLLGPP